MADYKCKKCGAKFEKSPSCGCSCSQEELKCPQCGSTEVKETGGLDRIGELLKNLNLSGGG